ncbi:MAG: type III pantothenate kinase [Enterococcus sp.]|nr:type III pantothenate kinase [Enterococcus sp.]
MMVLAVDIGNTKTCLALYSSDTSNLLESQHYIFFNTKKNTSCASLKKKITWLLGTIGVDISQISAVCVCSVVPNLNNIWKNFVEETSAEFLLCDYQLIKQLIKIDYPIPEEVGADFYCAAIAANALYSGAKIIVDFGTATNFAFVNSRDEFVGGIICPGVDLSGDALLNKASLLDHFEPRLPKHVIGTSSQEALLSGIVLGEVKRADGLIEAAIEEWGEKQPNIIFTGGYCQHLLQYSRFSPVADKELVLKGAYLCFKKYVK